MIGVDPVTRRIVPLDEPDDPALWNIRLLGIHSMAERKSIVLVERIEKRIYFIREQKVMLDC